MIDRRTFLQSTIALPVLCSIEAARAQTRGRVIVAGAGLAGLAAASELNAAGYDVVVLEARARPGGRVYTMREPFSDGLHADAGAARIQDTHEHTLRYVKQFGLTLDPFFPTSGKRVTRVAGKRLVGNIDLGQVPLQFSDEERRLGLGGSLAKYLFSHIPALGNPASPDWPTSDLSRFEMPIDDFCRQQGASTGVLHMIALGHDLTGMSTLQLLRDAALGANTKVWFKIRGGNDLLPKALAAPLASRIHYGTPIVRLAQDEKSVHVTCLQANTPHSVTGDYLVCTLPASILRGIEFTPAISPRKRTAIEEVGSLAMARVFLQSRRRFWLDRDETGWAGTDDPIDIWDYTRDQPGIRGILGAYTSGRMTHQLTAMERPARGPFVLELMERVHPGIREHFETSAHHNWSEDPWARGAGAAFDAGHLSKHYQALRTPEGRIHFAGEHTSPWSGWMNGGLESGTRAAAEIKAR